MPSPILSGHDFWARVLITLPDTTLFMIPHLFLAYTLMYWVIPRLIIPARYKQATAAVILLMLTTAMIAEIITITILDWIHVRFFGMPSMHGLSILFFCIGMMAGLRGGLTIGGFAAAIKLMKCFYERQQAALTFEKEKVNAELQMLKAQLHPHFLFNTLNNIYSLTQETSAKASSMIMGLSAILRYILYDCNKPWVPLKKELEMIREYLHLEALRYDQSLDLAITIPADTKASIAPLLLLPFVENSFKHGASTMIDKPWISLNVELTGNTLSLQLVNGKSTRTSLYTAAPNANLSPSSGIGIANVRKRLELIYPQRHILQINEEEEIFYVNLKIDLYTDTPQDQPDPQNPHETPDKQHAALHEQHEASDKQRAAHHKQHAAAHEHQAI